MRFVCPKCQSQNQARRSLAGANCTYCNYFITPDDINNRVEWRKDLGDPREVQTGCWSVLNENDVWGQQEAGNGFWGYVF